MPEYLMRRQLLLIPTVPGVTLVVFLMIWINISGSSYFQAHREYVQGYPFYHELYMFFETTWLKR